MTKGARLGRPLPITRFGLKLCDQFRHYREQIRDQTIVGHLKNRGLFVLVDGDDDFAVLHPGKVLNCTGNPDGHIKLRRHDLAGLPDLPVVRRIAAVHSLSLIHI